MWLCCGYQSYEVFLEQAARAEKRAQTQRPAVVVDGASEGAGGEEKLADSLFFVDSAGGEADAVSAASSKKKKKKSGKKGKQTQAQAPQGKRKREE